MQMNLVKSKCVPELSVLSEGGGVISLEGEREWRPTMEERGEGEGVWGSMIVWKLFIAAMETCQRIKKKKAESALYITTSSPGNSYAVYQCRYEATCRSVTLYPGAA